MIANKTNKIRKIRCHSNHSVFGKNSARRDLNTRPADPESAALSN